MKERVIFVGAIPAAGALLLALALGAGATDLPAGPPFYSSLESEVLAELNLARSHPGGYAEHLQKLRRSFRSRFTYVNDGVVLRTEEGTDAVDEAITFLEKAAPVPTLKGVRGLALAARDHALDQALRGGTGHRGSDGSDPGQRMNRYGRLGPEHFLFNARRIAAGEIIGYGRRQARDIVVMLIVDDDVPDRGHRQAIFNPDYTQAGVAFGPHPLYGWVCVVDFASSFRDKRMR